MENKCLHVLLLEELMELDIYIQLTHTLTYTHNRNTYWGFKNNLFQLGNNVMYASLMLHGKRGRRVCLLYCDITYFLKIYWFCSCIDVLL